MESILPNAAKIDVPPWLDQFLGKKRPSWRGFRSDLSTTPEVLANYGDLLVHSALEERPQGRHDEPALDRAVARSIDILRTIEVRAYSTNYPDFLEIPRKFTNWGELTGHRNVWPVKRRRISSAVLRRSSTNPSRL